jgi:hypothetical protein
MQFNLFLVLGLAASAIAAPVQLETRDTAVIDASVRRISNALTRLDSAFKSRRPGGDVREAEKSTDNFLVLHREVVEELRFGSREVRRGPNVNAFEALQLYQRVDGVTKLLQSVVDGWKDSKRIVVTAGKKNVVLDELLTASEASQQFAEAIIQKLPLLEQGAGQTFKQQHFRILETAITEYKKK